MDTALQYEALSAETLASRLGATPVLLDRIGANPDRWRIREVGDGNLNLVFIVESDGGAVVVKQALPYIRLVGESWPLPLKRAFFEYHALTRQAAHDPGSVPQIYLFDESQALIAMEYLSPHIILRRALIEGRALPDLARDLGLFTARTLFRGSDLAMSAAGRKADLALFAGNVELCDITENLVFSDPYFEAPLNRHTSPYLDELVATLRADRDLKVEAQNLKHAFTAKAQTLLHGDLHTGSIMVTEIETKIIDPEFAFYGPIGFDVGMLLSNFWMAYFSQRGHERAPGERDAKRAEILDIATGIWKQFREEFSRLWHTERNGILYQRSLFEDQGDELGAEQALHHVLADIWRDAMGFAGIEMHRRILGLAHNADFEKIEDEALRAKCEANALKLGRHLVVNRCQILDVATVNALAERLNAESTG